MRNGFLTRGVVLAAALVTLLFGQSQAAAADQIGDSYGGSGGANCDDYGGTHIQTASAGNSYAAPYDGVITSWSNQGYFWETITFKVARLGSGPGYSVVGSDGPRTVGAFNQKETYPVRLPVRQGDVIGGHIPVDDYTCVYGGSTYVLGRDDADTPAGSSGSFDESFEGRTPVEAVIERDRDGDGFGDETQDACPTNAAAQGPCPLPTTLGETFASESSSCSSSTYIPTAPADVVYAASADGVITSWSFQGAALVDGTVKLKITRPLGGAEYRTVAAAQPQVPVANVLSSFPTRIGVREGDNIALTTTGTVSCKAGFASGDGWFLAEDVPPGSLATYSANNRKINLAAVLEADADNDGFGDTTQDLCPTDASTQGQCSVVGPPDDSGCKKAKAKLKRAKAKLKKLKRADAAKAKVDAAQTKVKKAKKAVKKAC